MSWRAGSVLAFSVSPYGFVHVGVASDRPGFVIHNSRRRGGVVEEPLSSFSEGRPVRAVYPGRLPPKNVVARARTQIGRPYRLFGNNCEHFVRFAHALHHASPQLRRAAAGVGAITGLLAFAAASRS